jgi:CRP-like cAMP-binding protein
MQQFWDRINFYGKISDESKSALEHLLRKRTFKKNEFFIKDGQVPKTVAFVVEGLFSQYFTADNGDVIIKRFFPENYFVGSVSAMLTKTPSNFAIKALEPSTVLEYDFWAFKKLAEKYNDIAAFYIKYLELHWVVEKEPQEISLKYDSAGSRYAQFLKQFPNLESRLKQHEIASYLGVTPTQLSRIRSAF